MERAADTARLFFALWPDPDLKSELAAWAKQVAGKGRPMRRENIHLTLVFLGATDTVLIPELIALAAGVRFAPFILRLDRAAYWKHNRIIWCGPDEEPQALAALVEDLRMRLDAGGIRYDRKAFVSHLTLVRDAAGLSAVPAWRPLVWETNDFALVASTRVEGRVAYQVLQRFAAQTA